MALSEGANKKRAHPRGGFRHDCEDPQSLREPVMDPRMEYTRHSQASHGWVDASVTDESLNPSVS